MAEVVYHNVGLMIKDGYAPATKQKAYMLVRDSRPIIIKDMVATQGPWTYPLHHPTPEEVKELFDYIAPPPDATDTMLALAKANAGLEAPEEKTDWASILVGALIGRWFTK